MDGSFPALYCQDDIFEANGRSFLNDSRIKLMKPASEPCTTWGEGFPWLAKYLDLIMGDVQLPYMIAWMAHFYNSALRGKPVWGLALFMAGSVDAGKTFFNNAVLHQIFGGSGQAIEYLPGADKFNAELFACPIWTVDDAVSSTDPKSRARFSQLTTAVVANDKFTCRAMYKEGVKLRGWGDSL